MAICAVQKILVSWRSFFLVRYDNRSNSQFPSLLALRNLVKKDRSECEVLSEAEHLLVEMKQLWTESDEIWERCRNQLEFGSFVSTDYLAIYRELIQLQGQVETVLEWGSGLGVVTIMASRLGFDAYRSEEHTSELQSH